MHNFNQNSNVYINLIIQPNMITNFDYIRNRYQKYEKYFNKPT